MFLQSIIKNIKADEFYRTMFVQDPVQEAVHDPALTAKHLQPEILRSAFSHLHTRQKIPIRGDIRNGFRVGRYLAGSFSKVCLF